MATLLLIAARAARADGAPAPGGPGWQAWTGEPLLLLGLAALWWIYARGALAAWERLGIGRGVTRAQAGAFAGGVLVLLAALASPLDAWSGRLASAHMAQHMLLMLGAAPLLAFGTPVAALLWALPPRGRKAAAAWVRRVEAWYDPAARVWHPAALWGTFAAALWIWHAPALYEAALANRFVHDAQHLSFLLCSVLFWRVLLDPVNRLRLSPGAGVLYLFTTCLHASAIGIFMTLSPRLWYGAYAAAPAGSPSPLEDQQLAGLLMWVPGCLVYAAAAAGLFAAWLRQAAGARARWSVLLEEPSCRPAALAEE